MKIMISSFREAWKILKGDKIVLFFSIFPATIGAVLYYFLGRWFFGSLLGDGQEWIKANLASGGWGDFLAYIFIGLATILLFVLISWTFVLLVSLIACPFNDIISKRVEKILINEAPESVSQSVKGMVANVFKTIKNEVKKIALIIFLTMISLIFSFIPILAPVSVLLTALLLAISFVDYNWCRHDFNLGACVADIKGSLISYVVAGGIFLGLLSIPVINVFVLPYAVVYFTVVFVKKRKSV